MVLILVVAGIAHFLIPQSFIVAMPPYIPWHLEIIFFTGFVELVLAAGLLYPLTRYWASLMLTLYFIAILPAHIHVAIHGIEMFGIKNKLLLWGRTAFQAVFIWWAFSLRGKRSLETV